MDQQQILTIAVVAVIVAGSSFVQTLIGFGFAIIALPLFSFVLDLREANVIVALNFFVSVVAGAWTHRKDLMVTPLLICLAGGAFGLPFGLYIFSTIDVVWLIRLTGLIILALAVDGYRNRHSAGTNAEISWPWTMATGAASGILAGAVGMGGPPVAAYATRQSWPPRQIKAFLLTFLLLLGVMRLIGLATTGWIGEEALMYSACSLPFAMLGGHLGLRASHNIDAVLFRRITMATLVLLSLGMIFRS